MIAPSCEQLFEFGSTGWNPARPLIFGVNWVANEVIESIVNRESDVHRLIILGFIQSNLAPKFISGEPEQSCKFPVRKEWTLGCRLQAHGDDLMIGLGEHGA